MKTFKPGQYAAVVKEAAEGCDYTIGCAEKTIPLAATTPEDAAKEVAKLLQEDYGYPDADGGIKHVLIVTVATVMSQEDVFALMSDEKDEEEDEEDEATAARRRQYETLKREFGQ